MVDTASSSHLWHFIILLGCNAPWTGTSIQFMMIRQRDATLAVVPSSTARALELVLPSCWTVMRRWLHS